MSEHPLTIFSGSAHRQLAQEVCDLLSIPLGQSTTQRFPDGELHVEIEEVVRDQDVFLIQPCGSPVNDNLMELLLYLDAFRRASVHKVNAIIPYFPYARQERMVKGREAISARVVANLLENQGVQRVIFVDIHNPAIQGFFNIPVDPLSALPVIGPYFKTQDISNAAIVSPDVGRATLCGKYAEYLNLPLVVMHKRRTASGVKSTHVVGEIVGRRPIIIDDIIASGSTLSLLDALYQAGAQGKACFAITHPVLLPSAIQTIRAEERIESVVVTNSLPVPSEKRIDKITVLSIAPLLSDIISRIYHGRSITDRLTVS
ncbi:MAG: ribose-phosphate diphosphokinase [Chloroflexi bacterium]|nr:ribose-phosphate diphosphokinase [Anaerolineaceae bacterium]NMB88788.1 ribose-phosphate diphosphokinase [Chloroflexota bacterium]